MACLLSVWDLWWYYGREAAAVRTLRRDDDGRPQREQRLQPSNRPLGDPETPRRHRVPDGRRLVGPVDRELVPAAPSGREMRLDPRQPERERSVVAGPRERD